jgi:hypothetical protein
MTTQTALPFLKLRLDNFFHFFFSFKIERTLITAALWAITGRLPLQPSAPEGAAPPTHGGGL